MLGLTGQCDCPRCYGELRELATDDGGHRFGIGIRLAEDCRDDAWRWECGCGAAGQHQSQFRGLAYHRWRQHAGLSD